MSTPGSQNARRRMVEVAKQLVDRIQGQSDSQMDAATQAYADLRRTTLIGSAGAIALLSGRVSAPTDEASAIASLAILFFAAAIYFCMRALQRQHVEQAVVAARLQEHAVQTFRSLTSEESLSRAEGGKPVIDVVPTPDLELKETNAIYSRAYGCMIGGGVLSALHLFYPLAVAAYHDALAFWHN